MYRRFCPEGVLPTLDDPGLKERLADRPLPSGGVLAVGPNGSHKTHLLAARACDAARRGFSACLVSSAEIVLEVRASYSPASSVNEQEIMRRYAGVEYLALDDLGVGKLVDGRESEASRILFYVLLDQRYSHGLVTDISTNCLPEELEQRFDERIARRIAEMCTTYPMLLGGTLPGVGNAEMNEFRPR